MLRFRPNSRCAAGATALWLAMWPAAAQDSELRGPIIASELDAVLLPGMQTSAQRDDRRSEATGETGDYEPTSAGALADEGGRDDGTRIAATGAADEMDDPASTAGESSGPSVSTARERRRARRDGAEGRATGDGSEAPGEGTDTDPATGSIRAAPVDADEQARNDAAQPTNERVSAIGRSGGRREEDPYAPPGLRLGTLTVLPTLEQGLTGTTNADYSSDGESAILSETSLRLFALDERGSQSATFEAFGTLRESISGASVSEFELGARGEIERELRGGYTALASLGYEVGPEDAATPVDIAGAEDRPLKHDFEAGLGLEKDVGRLRLGMFGDLTREQYADAELTDGSTLSQRERNSTLALLRLRTGYELSPALVPFVEAEIGRRFYDRRVDSAGYERSATRLGARAGLALDLREKLSGEVAAGWIREDFDDARLAPISGPGVTAALEWSPLRGMLARLDGETIVEGTTDAGDSGSILYSAAAALEHDLRANLTGELYAGAGWRDYSGGGHELTLAGQAGLTWWMNRYAGIVGRLRHERLTSDLDDRDYERSSVYLGMRVRR